MERARRSSFQTTSVSPLRMYAQRFGKLRPVDLPAGCFFAEDALAACFGECISLQVCALVLGAYPCVSDFHVTTLLCVVFVLTLRAPVAIAALGLFFFAYFTTVSLAGAAAFCRSRYSFWRWAAVLVAFALALDFRSALALAFGSSSGLGELAGAVAT